MRYCRNFFRQPDLEFGRLSVKEFDVSEGWPLDAGGSNDDQFESVSGHGYDEQKGMKFIKVYFNEDISA
jgi:hypothetical protein